MEKRKCGDGDGVSRWSVETKAFVLLWITKGPTDSQGIRIELNFYNDAFSKLALAHALKLNPIGPRRVHYLSAIARSKE